MKEATGELSTTVIAVVAIAAVLGIFTAFLLPSLRASLRARTYCSSSTQCGACTDGKMDCHYNIENDDGTLTVSDDTIQCDCENGQ